MKCWNFIGSRVVTDHVEVALRRVELQRKPARVAPRVWAASLACHGGEPDQRVGLGARLEYRSPGVLTDVAGHLEVPESAATLGVRLAFRDALPVELGHLLDQVVILQKNRAVRTDRQRLLVAGCGGTAVGCGVALGHVTCLLVKQSPA
jgi:hypothetical protein